MKKNSLMALVIGLGALVITVVMTGMIFWSLDQTILFVGGGTREGVYASSPIGFLGIQIPSAILLGILIQMLPTMFVIAEDRFTILDQKYSKWIWFSAYVLFTFIDFLSNESQIVTERLGGDFFSIFSGTFPEFLANATWLFAGAIVTQFEELLFVMIGITSEHLALAYVGFTGRRVPWLAGLIGNIQETGRMTSKPVAEAARVTAEFAESAFGKR